MLLIIIGIALSLPIVQTKIAQYYTAKINYNYGTDINVERVEITIFGGVQLKNVLINDENKNPLISAKRLSTTILDAKKLINGQLLFSKIDAEDLYFNIHIYKNQTDSNFDKFIAAFDDGKKANKDFLMTSKSITISNGHFLVLDDNIKNPVNVNFTKLNANFSNFKILGPNLNVDIDKMSFKDHRGLEVENLTSKFTYTKKNIKLEQLDLKTNESVFKGNVTLNYNREDFSDFNNKVVFDIKANEALIATNDIRYFYNELGKNKTFTLKGKIDGTLNNFTIKKLLLKDDKKSEISGNVTFKNLFQKEGQGSFYMNGSFNRLSSSYANLIELLPIVLGKKLPSSLSKLGNFNLVGNAEITTTSINTDFDLTTRLGNIKSDIYLTNIDNIDNASYIGTINLDNFDLGSFLNRTEVGKVTLDLTVDGKGFTEKYLDTKLNGEIRNFMFNGYNYKKIIADGSFKMPIFKGKVNVNDPNLLLDFDGVVNLSKKENVYDFHAMVDYANLKALNILKDRNSFFRGDLVMKMSGNTVNNLKGDVLVTNASYRNDKDTYFFDSLTLSSQFDELGERMINIYSPDAIKGEITGIFEFNQIQKMVENSIGSLYANYKPNQLKKGQHMTFNFSEFNKLIEIVFPEIELADDALIRGSINGDDNNFKMDFTSNSLKANSIELDNVQVEIDNKNPLYNVYIQLDSIKTKQYKIRDFSLINVTARDTLFFRTEFKGGNFGNDFYNLNLYHTINKEKQNTIGFNKSEVMFKDYIWNINEKEDNKNKVVFDKDFKNFNFDDIIINHEKESLKLAGTLNGSKDKDLQLTFDNVNLHKITPDVEKFKFDGFVDGIVNIKQVNDVYQPTSRLTINELEINDNLLGSMDVDIVGNENFRKFNISSSIKNENFESFNAIGNIELVKDQAVMDLVLSFQKFNLGILSKIGGDVITNIRGLVSGSARLSGNLDNIDYSGRLFVNDTGLSIPYIKTDYVLADNTIVDVTNDKFIILPTTIKDSKFNTSGNFGGFIKHNNFGNWELNLNLASSRFLVLNTIDHEDAAYYGTAFIDGSASIVGPTSGLVINVNAKSEKGTDIKIPINNAQSISDNEYIHFITEKEKNNVGNPTEFGRQKYSGLELNFDLDIYENANIEVILNRESGHGMKGNGRGGLLFSINTLGKFEMYGDFQVYQGSYRFKYAGLIDKTLEVKKFSSISWEGDPLKAILNLEAIYKTTANPALLVENASVNKKVDVEVSVIVHGTLDNPEPDFNINLPTVSSILKSEIQTKLDDPATRQTQALALLSTGTFVTANTSSNAAYGSLFETASGLFSGLFNEKDGKFQVGIDYTQADTTPGIQTNGQVGVTLSTKVNDRITINGKVGVPVGGVNESAIIGNVELQYRVNEDGTLNLRVFNRENDINYIGEGIGYTQGVGITYEVDFDIFKELVNKIFKNIKIDTVKEPEPVLENSYLPDYININKDKKE